MDAKLASIKRLCEAYIGNANSGLKLRPDDWWSGYYIGQKKMADMILKWIKEEE